MDISKSDILSRCHPISGTKSLSFIFSAVFSADSVVICTLVDEWFIMYLISTNFVR